MDRFKELIKSMPVDFHAFTSKKSTWHKYLLKDDDLSIILSEIFMGNDFVEISRKDLFDLAKAGNYKKFIISTILWGYPAGMRGNHFQNIADDIVALSSLLKQATEGISDWSAHYSEVKKIRGLGLSTYTKFLYFIEAKVNSFPCVIFDKRIIDTINKKSIDGFYSLKQVKSYNSDAKYPEYLKCIDVAAKKYEAKHGQVEMFVFQFGLNIKTHK